MLCLIVNADSGKRWVASSGVLDWRNATRRVALFGEWRRMVPRTQPACHPASKRTNKTMTSRGEGGPSRSQPLRDPLAASPPPPAGASQGKTSADRTTEATTTTTTPSSACSISGLSLGLPRSKGGRSTLTAAKATTTADATSSAQRLEHLADAHIRSTDNDALTSRLSALKGGYLAAGADPFSELFVFGQEFSRGLRNDPARQPLNPPIHRRPPIINIGTCLRCETLDRLVEAFLLHGSDGTRKQIVSLGAGSDARYWRIMADARLRPHLAHYLELDFPQNVAQKLYCIERFPALQEQLQGDVRVADSELVSKRYAAKGCDLRQLASSSSSSSAPQLSTLDPTLPTLILAECVLSYLPPQASVSVLETVASRLQPETLVAGISYEMCIAGEDASATLGPFAKVMLRNLESRGLSVVGARSYASAQSHAARMQQAFARTSSGATTLKSIWKHLTPSERDRLSRLEGLDEVEELELLLGCYCISWGIRGDDQGKLRGQFQASLSGSTASQHSSVHSS